MKFKKFQTFAAGLLPHETAFLLHQQQFEDADNLRILQAVHLMVDQNLAKGQLDESIDKRKYSRLMQWIQNRLEQADVDKEFDSLIRIEKALMTDSIDAAGEKWFVQLLKRTESGDYYFMKRYELAMHFMHYLQIRLRHKEYAFIQDFLQSFQQAYRHSKEVYQQLAAATEDITRQYTFNDKESHHWENWLLSIFRKSETDGFNRYYALVRLTFLYYNYGQYGKMEKLYDEIDVLLRQGIFYSRRILFNYYGNRLLFHSKAKQLALAEKYGYLSVRDKNSDYLHYINNLSSVLLKQDKAKEAHQLMKEAFADMKVSPSFHHKTSFAALYVRSLNDLGMSREAESYAEIFLMAYKEQVMQHRWHLFFATFLQSLFLQGKYKKVLQVIQKNQLLSKEEKYLKKVNSIAAIQWYHGIAQYKTEQIEIKELQSMVAHFYRLYASSDAQQKTLQDLLAELKKAIPESLFALSQPRLS